MGEFSFCSNTFTLRRGSIKEASGWLRVLSLRDFFVVNLVVNLVVKLGANLVQIWCKSGANRVGVYTELCWDILEERCEYEL